MDEFDYELPSSAIAQVPVEPRDAARLLVDMGPGDPPQARHVSDLASLVGPGDVVVLNETRVMPARLPLRKPTGGAAEVLLLTPLEPTATGNGRWEALVRPSRRIAAGAELVSQRDPAVRVVVGERLDSHRRAVQVFVGERPVLDVSQTRLLERAGEAPLPPYIDPREARRGIAARYGISESDDHAARTALADRYQTVFGRSEGSAAAPTAGLHLTEQVLDGVRAGGAEVATVDLTVGLGTFAPITAADAQDHTMHAEHYRVPAQTLETCRGAQRVVAIGTTTVRALESAARADCARADGDVSGRTDLFLRRGSEFLLVDAMLTNFHLPRSSLLVLIDAFVGPRWRDLYGFALEQGFRFLSFGDATLLRRSR